MPAAGPTERLAEEQLLWTSATLNAIANLSKLSYENRLIYRFGQGLGRLPMEESWRAASDEQRMETMARAALLATKACRGHMLARLYVRESRDLMFLAAQEGSRLWDLVSHFARPEHLLAPPTSYPRLPEPDFDMFYELDTATEGLPVDTAGCASSWYKPSCASSRPSAHEHGASS